MLRKVCGSEFPGAWSLIAVTRTKVQRAVLPCWLQKHPSAPPRQGSRFSALGTIAAQEASAGRAIRSSLVQTLAAGDIANAEHWQRVRVRKAGLDTDSVGRAARASGEFARVAVDFTCLRHTLPDSRRASILTIKSDAPHSSLMPLASSETLGDYGRFVRSKARFC